MKKIGHSILLMIITITAFSQSTTTDLPSVTVLIHYKLSVGYNTTTVLIFPAPVKQADRGERDLLAQKQPGVENVLNLKAARRDFPSTNLHVFTSDGRVYAFDVSYFSDPPQTTYDLGKLDAISSAKDHPKDRIKLSEKPLDTAELARNIAQVKAAQPFFSTHSNKYKMKVQLQTIYRSGDILFFGLKITNRSTLPYPIEFTKLLILDRKRAKRSSIQEREIVPLYKDTVSTIMGKSAIQWVIAVPQLTISDHRQLIWEMNEMHGGRNMILEIKNRQIFHETELNKSQQMQ